MEYTFENVFVDRKGFSLIYLVNIEIDINWNLLAYFQGQLQ